MIGVSRRSFAESLALAALAPLIGERPEAIHFRAWTGPVSSEVLHDPGALAKALVEVIRRQYGSRLSREDLATIARQIQTGLDRVDQLRQVELANGDEPDSVFSAIRNSRPAP